MQHDFVDPAGSLSVAGGPETVAPIVELIRRFRRDGHVVAFTQDWHPAVTPHFAEHGGLWPVHCVHDSAGAELHPDIAAEIRDGDPLIRKGDGPEDAYSGFSVLHLPSGRHAPTGLAEALAERGVHEVTVVGLAGDWCVKATALDAVAHGHPTTVPLALTRFVELRPGDTERAVAEMRAAGVTVLDT
ncbi:isochorismatase family protein [Nakamurella sp. YIM 132084]|uniref:nicotinamidase n=2 Tax=Nakamurella leprariae TaxID=2803911 RepID=A0A939BW54_9ACTN|nr:isochorismatase family protein [Nakamurella leprariae]